MTLTTTRYSRLGILVLRCQGQLAVLAGAERLPLVVERVALVVPVHGPVVDPLRPVLDGGADLLGHIVRRDDEFVLVVVIGDGGGEGEVSASVEGRVDVNEVDLAGELGQQAGQDVFLVAPDEAVASGLLLLQRLEQALLAILGRLVDGLDGLEGEGHPQRRDALVVGIVFAVPNHLRSHGHGWRLPPLARWA